MVLIPWEEKWWWRFEFKERPKMAVFGPPCLILSNHDNDLDTTVDCSNILEALTRGIAVPDKIAATGSGRAKVYDRGICEPIEQEIWKSWHLD